MRGDIKALALSQGLTEAEFDRIVAALGRLPTEAEVAVFSAMWNEHVSYKSSKIYLRWLPTKGPSVLVGPGENAGVVDIGGGLALAFKIESHNHPSYIEPFQGAATGVGGILRDIFTMGARPIAILDSLRFGSPQMPRTPFLFSSVVSGIAHYGNCVGVPTVGGEIVFDEAYNHNCLVNVLALGVARKERIFFGRASVPGTVVVYAGAPTGRDGILGASMASASFDEEATRKKPTVQVGDPFREKCLLEACLEIMERGLIIGIQDMGAAGLTCSTFEMAARGGTGMVIDLSKVPLRATGMTASEVLLSESQERMLMVAPRGSLQGVLDILSAWDLCGVAIGEVTGTKRIEMYFEGEKVVDLPVDLLTEGAPVYERPWSEPEDLEERRRLPPLGRKSDIWESFLSLLDDPTFRSKSQIFEQYDHMVGVSTVVRPQEADAAVLRLLDDPPRGVAVTTDGNGPMCWLDPYAGSYNLVAEAVLNLACVGARPVGLTDCLNFGNPEQPQVMWEFREAVRGIADACKAFEVPVTGGNVSFYNETSGRSIYPTPVVGVVGIVEDVQRVPRAGFCEEGDVIVLLGPVEARLDGSVYLRKKTGLVRGKVQRADPRLHRALCNLIIEGIEEGIIRSAHDCSDGGLLFAIAECIAMSKMKLGATLDMAFALSDPENILFGEAPSRAIVTTKAASLQGLLEMAERLEVPVKAIGVVGGPLLRADPFIAVPVDTILARYRAPLPGL